MFLLPTPSNADWVLQGKILSGYLIPPFRQQQQKSFYIPYVSIPILIYMENSWIQW